MTEYYDWKAPDLDHRQKVEDIEMNDHIFVKFDGYGWRRSKVYQKFKDNQDDIWITVKNLTEWQSLTLNLSKKVDTDKIQFRDMRYNNADVLIQLGKFSDA